MQRATLVRRTGLGLLVLLILLVAALGVAGTGLVRQSWPATSGEIRLGGLGGTVSVVRDQRGVPHIYADNPTDLFRGQGFVAAQDRFFEMDLRRHIAAGRLSELVGAGGLETDKAIRTMGWRRVAEEELPRLATTTRQYLSAYADGVNDYITRSGDPSNMALEYTVLGASLPAYKVERWTAVDSLAWLKAMAWDLKGNYDNELARGRLGSMLDPALLKVIFPEYPAAQHAPILSDADWRPAAATSSGSAVPDALRSAATDMTAPQLRQVWAGASRVLDAVPVTLGRGDGVGSNSWVVGPSRTTTGKPLLANDPHLGTSVPGIWYQTGLHCRQLSSECPFDVTGFSFAGLPGIIVGHNNRIAWGITNLGPDVTDFYLERVTGSTYLRDGQQVPLTLSTETIKVAGGADVTLPVRRTGHGPIISDVLTPVADAGRRALVRGVPQQESYAVSLAWTGLVPGNTADAIFAIDTAQNFTAFREAARSFAVPAQNLVYADEDGHIGYQAPGQIPVRRSATPSSPPGYWPAPGWDSQWDWQGYVPFDQMPWVLDPPEGFIVAANQAVTAASSPFLTTEWDLGFRSQRIRELIEASPKVSPRQMGAMQLDTTNGFAPTLVRALVAVDLSDDPFSKQAQDLLTDWNFTQPVDKSRASAAAAYYNAVWSRLLEYTFDDQLPPDLRADGGARWMLAVEAILKDPSNGWWDDKKTPGLIEGKDEILHRAMVRARLDLTRRLGKDPATWGWGRLHTLTLRHRVLGQEGVPDPVQALFNRGPVELPGGSAIVNANGWDASKGFEVDKAPSMRMVVDLADLDASTWVNQTGASGHPYSPHYVDQTDAWARGESYPWPSSEGAVRAAKQEELTLTPR